MSEPEGPWVEPEEARCGLLLMPPAAPGPAPDEALAAVLATGAVVAYVAGAEREAAFRLCARHGVACLSLGDPDPALDGVHLLDPGRVAEARRRLRPGAIVGAACGRSRHAAMVAGEEGADYVLFGAAPEDELLELCRWWSELFVLPCAVETPGLGIEGYIEAGADFVAVGAAVWEHPDGAMEAALLLLRQIERGRAARRQQT